MVKRKLIDPGKPTDLQVDAKIIDMPSYSYHEIIYNQEDESGQQDGSAQKGKD